MNLDNIDRRILKAVARGQTEKEPFECDIEGIMYQDVNEEFTNEDFNGVNPDARLGWRLWHLYDQGYLMRVFEASNSPHRYRLSEQGRSSLSETCNYDLDP
jgi:hypothetical protein